MEKPANVRMTQFFNDASEKLREFFENFFTVTFRKFFVFHFQLKLEYLKVY